MNFLLLLLVTTLALGAKAAGIKERLISSKRAEVGEFPYQVSIRFNGNHYCGGALITKRHVLTAAHCVVLVQNQAYNKVSIVIGSNNLSSGTVYKIKALASHPDFVNSESLNWMYDIGVFTLESDVQLSKYVKLVKLASKETPAGETAVVSGWGPTTIPALELSETLQKLTLKVISLEECKNRLPSSAKVDPSYICTYVDKGIGPCSGDSGGPLVANGELIGIVSGGIPCAQGYPDIFTAVYKYQSFINEILKK